MLQMFELIFCPKADTSNFSNKFLESDFDQK